MATTAFNDLITFSRGSNATVVGSNGLIQWAPNNLLTNSQDFEAAAWVKTTVTVSANVANAPDSTATADRMTVSSTGAQAFLALNPGVTLGLPYTASIYVKRVNSDWFALSNQNFFAYFNLSGSGSIGTVGEGSASITAVGDGWFRITWSGSTSWSTAIRVRAVTADNNPAAVSGQEYLIWGAQLELGSTATTYNNTSVRNLLGFSEAFDNAAWTKGGTSIVTGAQANPVNGLFNAQKLMEDTANAQHIVQQGLSVVSGTPYVFSVYAKAAGRNRFSFRFGSISPADTVTFDLSNGTIVTGSSGYVASITSIGSGWYRCSITSTPSSSGTRQHQIYLNSASGSGVETYTGDGNSGVYIYGAMLSNSASLDPYVPTPGAAPSSTAYHGPRFDYDPVTLLPRGLLIEEQRTNLLTYSEQFDNAAWTKTAINPFGSGSVANTTATTDPMGGNTADFIQENNSSSEHRVINASAVTVVNGSQNTATIYAKQAVGSRYLVAYQLTGTVGWGAYVDLSTGSLASSVAIGAGVGSASVTSVGNGWYKVTITSTAVGTSSVFSVGLSDGLSATYLGNGISGIYIWGAQLEAGAFATSYIPTIASTVTRSADVATITGSLFSQWYNQSEGGFIIDYGALASFNFPTPFMAADSAASSTKRIQIYLSGNSPTYRVTDGTDQAAVSLPSVTIPATSKYAVTYRLNDFAGTANGGSVGTDTSGTIPAVNTLYIGNQNSAQFINGHIRSIRYVPVRAADFQLQQVTT